MVWEHAARHGLKGAARGLVVACAVAVAVATSARPAGAVADTGVTVVTPDACNSGSSNPTFYPNNRRMVVTSGGRQLAVYDGHGSAQQITWRDAGGTWQTGTTGGGVTNGYLPEALPNDRPASIVLGKDSGGAEHAWLVWSGYDNSYDSAIEMRRLSDLDSSSGPTVGPELEVEPAASARGDVRVDMVFEKDRGVISWLERTGTSSYDLVTTWFTNLDTDTPTFSSRHVLFSTSSATPTTTLVPLANGTGLVTTHSGRLEVFTHEAGAALTTWVAGGARTPVSSDARPSAVALDDGRILAAVESDTAKHVVEVVRFSGDGSSATVGFTSPQGYEQPALASDGTGAWLLMVRSSDRYLVSRKRSAAGSWSASDRVEVGAEGGGDIAWPNPVRETDGKLRVLVDGPRCSTHKTRNSVLAFERSVSTTPPPARTTSVSDVRVTEGTSAKDSTARFSVTLSGPASSTARVSYDTAPGTASGKLDYRGKSGRLTFAPGETKKTVTVRVIADHAREGNETFSLNLSKPAGATLARAHATATIVDDDKVKTSAGARVRKWRRLVTAHGHVTPDLSGGHVSVALLRRRGGRFVVVGRRQPILRNAPGNRSSYRARFRRRRGRRCRVRVKLAGTHKHAAATATRTFGC